jgi:hypothetical protein
MEVKESCWIMVFYGMLINLALGGCLTYTEFPRRSLSIGWKELKGLGHDKKLHTMKLGTSEIILKKRVQR